MADVSDPKIQEAYDQVRLDKSDTTVGCYAAPKQVFLPTSLSLLWSQWLLLGYAESKKDTLEVQATGAGLLSAILAIKLLLRPSHLLQAMLWRSCERILKQTKCSSRTQR